MKVNAVNMQFYGLLFTTLFALGNSVGSDVKRDEEEDPAAAVSVRLNPYAVVQEDIPLAYRKSIEYADVNHDGFLESFYVWKNPDGKEVRLPVIRGVSGISFPTVSDESCTPVEIPGMLRKDTYFMDRDLDGDMDAVFVEYGSHGPTAFPLTKKVREKSKMYMI